MRTPRVVVVEHEAACPPGPFGDWLVGGGVDLQVCRPWAGEELPAATDVDGWLVLGGSVGAYDDERAPWLPTVRDRIAEAGRAGVPVLGVCLGHQLAAVATGGRVEVNPDGQRVGLYEVGWLEDAAADPLLGAVATPRRAVQWNSDVVTALGPDARVLAALPDGEVQAVRFGDCVWGVQWHPEADRHILASWADGDRDDHLERGIDQEAVLDGIDAAREELEEAWRPLAESFARVVSTAVRTTGTDR